MVTTLENKTIISTQLEEEFQTLLRTTFDSEPGWLKEKRKEAFDAFCAKGIPSRKDEEYKYTDLIKVFDGKFTAIHNESHQLPIDINRISVAQNSVKLIFINGWLHKDSTLSSKLPKGVIVGNMAAYALFLHIEILKKYCGLTADENCNALSFLNSAFWFDGAFIFVPEKTIIDIPVEIIHICTGNDELLVNPRQLIVAEKNSQVQIIEHNISLNVQKSIVVNSVTEIFAAENTHLHYYKVQDRNNNIFLLHNTFAAQEKNSHFDTNTITFNSGWVRNNLNISIKGVNCESHLNGLFITNGNEHIDNHTSVQHNQPNCQSNQLYKGILDGKSTGIFNGKIFVNRNAQKTNAYQSSKNILMSDEATVNTKPQLEIYADDVKCSHGASTGRLDEDALFYLRSRGLSEASARNLLLLAFASDVIEKIQVEQLKKYLEELVNKQLHK